MPDISTTPDDKFELDMEDALNVHLNGFASGREYERKQIVEWLRHGPSDVIDIAAAIENREHLK